MIEYAPLLIEAIKFAGTVLSALTKKSEMPQLSAPEVQPPANIDKQFLQNVIDKATWNLSNLIKVTTDNIIQEMKRQYILSAVQEVQAQVTVFRQLLCTDSIEPNLAKHIVLTAINPLQVSMERARLRLREEGKEEIWNLCYLTGTTTLVAGYAFINKDSDKLKKELESKMQENQIMLLDDIARKTFAANHKFPWVKVPFLLSPEGTDDLSKLYNTVISSEPQATLMTPTPIAPVNKLTLRGHTKQVNSVAFSSDDKMLASGSGGDQAGDNTVKLWRISDGILLFTLGHTGKVNSVAFS